MRFVVRMTWFNSTKYSCSGGRCLRWQNLNHNPSGANLLLKCTHRWWCKFCTRYRAASATRVEFVIYATKWIGALCPCTLFRRRIRFLVTGKLMRWCIQPRLICAEVAYIKHNNPSTFHLSPHTTFIWTIRKWGIRAAPRPRARSSLFSYYNWLHLIVMLRLGRSVCTQTNTHITRSVTRIHTHRLKHDSCSRTNIRLYTEAYWMLQVYVECILYNTGIETEAARHGHVTCGF